VELDGQFAIVTGGGGGIGAACAAALTAAGARVAVIGRTAASLAATVAAGHAVDHAASDVTDEAALAAALVALADRHGPAGILVNNAGAAASAKFAATPAAEFRRMLDINLMGAVHATHAVLPAMLERGGGRVVNIASIAALRGYAYVTAYVAAKHALLGLTRALAVELAPSGVTVNAVCPGYTDTGLVADSVARIVAATGRSAEQSVASLTRGNPQGRLIEPAEIGRAVAFLCGPDARSITGIALPVAGGEIM
jgi:NAD(P)-dependent dehydrogenase (short-subunit alcohol dehydrogenase family)